MSQEHKRVVKAYGWAYHELPFWQRIEHHRYVALRSQTTAAAVSLPDLPHEIISLLAGAIDIHKRRRRYSTLDDVFYYNM